MMSGSGATPAPAHDSALLVGLERSKRGPGYSNVEDTLISKAFIAASENAVCGAHQKGKMFKSHMFSIYVGFLKDQFASDQALMNRSSQATREEYIKKGVGSIYPERSADSIYNRFKGQIAPEVMKYMGIEETTDMASGWNPDDHRTACLETFKQRYGHPFDFLSAYEYLRDKNKFSNFRTKIEEELRGSRPMGKKKARQAEADAKLIKSVISEVVVKQEKPFKAAGSAVVSNLMSSDDGAGAATMSGMGEVIRNISEVVSGVGNAILQNMQNEQDMRLAQSLDTPDRKAFVKEQLALRMAESRNKRCRLEMNVFLDANKNDDKNNDDDDDRSNL